MSFSPTDSTSALSGAFVLNLKRAANYPSIVAGVGAPVGKPHPAIHGKADGGSSPLGALRPRWVIHGVGLGASAILGRLGTRGFFGGVAGAQATTTGELRFVTVDSLDADQRAITAGRRPTTLPVVRYHGIHRATEIASAGYGEIFTVSSDYVATPADGLADSGARPNYLGMILDAGGSPVLRFRPPTLGEQFVDLNELTPRVWDGTAWVITRSMPERALRGQLAFVAFDTTGCLLTYAKLLGACQGQAQEDIRRIRDLLDPARCPDSFIVYLAHSLGAEIAAETPVVSQRETVRSYVQSQKRKGTPSSIETALRAVGATGYACQTWESPTTRAFVECPIGQQPTDPSLMPTSGLSIHVMNPDGSPIFTWNPALADAAAKYLVDNILSACSYIRYFTTDFACGVERMSTIDAITITEL